MRFAKLFPACADESIDETCVIGSGSFRVQDVIFAPLPRIDPREATWVDGGSAVLFSTPSRAIGIIKVCAVRTEGSKRTSIGTHSYLASITANGEDFLVRAEPLSNPDERITSCLQCDIPKADFPSDTVPEALIDVVRTLAEHCIHGQPGDIVIHDGSTRTTNCYLQKTLGSSGAHGIAKTTGILTSRSRPVGLALIMSAPPGTWHAMLTPDTAFARLHDHASHVFLIEGVTPELLSLLAAWSADMAFPGYPYPLVLADQLARVTNNERDAWKVILASDEDAIKVISGELKASDCHAMLEHILYGKQMY